MHVQRKNASAVFTLRMCDYLDMNHVHTKSPHLCCHNLHISFANKAKITSQVQKFMEDHLKLAE